MQKPFSRMLGSSLAGIIIALALFWLITRMIASDDHRSKEKDVQVALLHPIQHAKRDPRSPGSAAAARRKIDPRQMKSRRDTPIVKARSPRPPELHVEASAPKPAIHLSKRSTSTAKTIANAISTKLASSRNDRGRPYLPAPNRHLLRNSGLHATQTRYVCPHYPGFPHVGLNLKFSAHVNRRGRVTDFAVIRGSMSAGYRAALRRAVLQWRFRPLQKDGERLPFRIVDRVHLAAVGHACVYDYMTGGQPTATGRRPRWTIYFVSGVHASAVAMKVARTQ